MKTELLRSSKSDEWETPDALFQDLDKEFHFNLDACASSENHKCDMYYTKADNALLKNWGGSYSLVQSTIQQHKKLDAQMLLRRTQTEYYSSGPGVQQNRYQVVVELCTA